jgi:hypothetical protein
MLFFGWRGGSRVAMWGMFAWIALLFFSSLALVISDPGAMVQAETLHTEFPYAWVIFPFDALFFVLMAVWMIRFSKTTPPSRAARWNHVNSVLIAVAVALLPVEYALLNGGEQHGLLDGAGITVTLIQWIMLNLAFYPWKTSTERRREA